MPLDISDFAKQDPNTGDVSLLENLIAQSQILFTSSTVGVMGAIMGAAQPLTLSSNHDTNLIGTLNTDLTVTVTVTSGGASAGQIEGTQDATGGHQLFVTNGTQTIQPAIPLGANQPFKVLIHSPDGFNIFVSVGS